MCIFNNTIINSIPPDILWGENVWSPDHPLSERLIDHISISLRPIMNSKELIALILHLIQIGVMMITTVQMVDGLHMNKMTQTNSDCVNSADSVSAT